MDTALQIFNFQEQQVRIVIIDGNPWFVIADACKVLEIQNVSQATDRLDQDGVCLTEVIDSLGRKQKAAAANEPNLYRLIFRSDKPQAKAFQDWIYEEVLPSIRKTGSYSVQPSADLLTLFEQDVQQHPEQLQEAIQLTNARLRYLKLLQKAQQTDGIVLTSLDQLGKQVGQLPRLWRTKSAPAGEEETRVKVSKRVLAFLQRQEEPVSRRTITRYEHSCVAIIGPILDQLVASEQVSRIKILGSRVQWFYQLSTDNQEKV